MRASWTTPWDLHAADMAVRFLKNVGAPKQMLNRGGLLNTQVLIHLRRARLRRWAKRALQGSRTVLVVLGVRNRGGARLKHCLETLRAQDYPAKLLSIVLVDYGSNPAERAELRTIAQDYGADLVPVEADLWSRSHCNNIGFRRSNALFTMYSDVDLLYSPNYISACVAGLARSPLSVCYSHILDLPDGTAPEVRPAVAAGLDGLRELRAQTTPRFSERYLCFGNGVTFTRFLHEIGGMDEAFVGWGAEDDDLHTRLRAYGLRRLQVSSDEAFYLHQFHAHYAPADQDAWIAARDRNRRILAESVTTRRNDSGWGATNGASL